MDRKQVKIGRPRESSDGEVRSEIIKFLLTPGEKEMLQKVADVYGLTLSEYVRDFLMRETADLVNHGPEAAVTTMCASAEDKARTLGVDVKITPVFKKYDVVEP